MTDRLPAHVEAAAIRRRAEAQGQKGVKAAGELANESGAQKQFVRDDLRVRGRLFQGRNKSLSPAHRAKISGENR